MTDRSPGPGAVVGSILVRQEERSCAAVVLGDDPDAIIAVALARFGGINRVGRKDAKPLLCGEIVLGGVLGIYNAPIAANVTAEACQQEGIGDLFDNAACGNDLAQRERSVSSVRGGHVLGSFS